MQNLMSVKNPIFQVEDEDLILELDYENITNEEYNAIMKILKSCPTLVNNDVISISHEIIGRMERREIHANHLNIDTIRRLYYLLQYIPDTNSMQVEMRRYYGAFIKSPVASPVTPPKIMKKPSRGREKLCPC